MISNFTSGIWEGMKVEFGKIYGNPSVNAFTPLFELNSERKLRVFDFDDTLVKTSSNIYVTHKDGKKSTLTPGEYAVYTPKVGDTFDFSDFNQVRQPQEIKGVTKLLKTFASAEGERTIVILTARSAYKPVKDYLHDIGLDGIYVEALADNNPQKKADWIEDQIKRGFNDVFFIDDSQKNVSAVGGLKKKYPNVKFQVRRVKHDIPTAPKQVSEHSLQLTTLIPKK
jgi:hypothetical protein